MLKSTGRIVCLSLLALVVGACSSSKSAEKGSSGSDKTVQKKQELDQQDKKAKKSGESEDPSSMDPLTDKPKLVDKMHSLHGRLVKTYLDNRDEYIKRRDNAKSMELTKLYDKLVDRHDKIAKMYDYDPETGEKVKKQDGKDNKAAKKGEKKGKKKGKKAHKKHKPKWKHVQKMAKFQYKNAKLHRKTAELEKKAGKSDLGSHHSKFADAYDRLAGMHEQHAKNMRKKAAQKGKCDKKAEGKGEKQSIKKQGMKKDAESSDET